MIPNKETLINYLQTVDTGISVQFNKLNGDVRNIKATLFEGNIPFKSTEERSKTIADTKKESEVIKVYDMENQGWRSFRFSSVISVSVP
jgi:hypothetical protein